MGQLFSFLSINYISIRITRITIQQGMTVLMFVFNVRDHDGHANDRANKMLHHGCDCDHDVRILVSAKDN